MYSRFEKKHILFLLCFLVLALAPFQTHAQSSAPGVQLYWEASSYTPPFYKGKALPPSDDTVVVTAITPASFGDPSKLLYTWDVNGTIAGSLSGIGKSTFTVTGSPFVVDRFITVTVESADGSQEATGIVRLPAVKQKILVYEDAPLSGIHFETALTKIQSSAETDVNLVAYPFFFSDIQNQSSLNYRWAVSGIRPDGHAKNNVLGVPLENTGTTTISVSTNSLSHILQSAVKNIIVVSN